ncbi:hypothetical protein N0G65_002914 [Providencia rettgeri]|nr:hypothetical protein [Providencia rettgeri]
MKNPHGSDFSLFQRASIRHEMINRIHDVFDKAGMEVELSEDDIKFIMTSYLNLFTGKEWHLSSSVTLHGDIEIRQEIQVREDNHFTKVYVGSGYAGNASTVFSEDNDKQIEKETLQKLLVGGALACEDITLEERANKIARSIKGAFLSLEGN